jgi:hypothetical protein
MMRIPSYDHSRVHLEKGSQIVIICGGPCKLLLLDDSQFSLFESGNKCTAYSKDCTTYPASIEIPITGWWNVVVDFGMDPFTLLEQHIIRRVDPQA